MNKPELLRFYLWVARPRGVHNLKMILRHLTDEDLLHIIQQRKDSPVAAKIAWAEFGRRNNFINIEYKMRAVDVLDIEAKDLVLVSGLGTGA